MNAGARRSGAQRGAKLAGAELDHLGLTVPDLDDAVAFFVRVLGAELVSRDGPLVWDDPHVPPGPTLLGAAMLSLPPDGLIELLRFAPQTSASETPRGTDRRAGTPVPAATGHHVAIRVPDLNAAVQVLRRVPGVSLRGAPRTMPPGRARAGIRFVYVRTPWGLAIELIEDGGRTRDVAAEPAPSG